MSADGGEMTINERIVHELAEDGERSVLRRRVGGAQGVADAEAHAVMLSEDDVHGVVGFVIQSEWAKEGKSGLLGGFDDLSEDLDVVFEGLAAGGGDLVTGAWAGAGVVAVFFEVTGGAEGAEVGDEIAVAHAEFRFEILEGPFAPRGEQRHDGEAALFVDELVDLIEVDHFGGTSVGLGPKKTARA